MSKNQLHIVAVQSYGYIDGPDDQSSGAQGSRARLDEALALVGILSHSHDVIFLFPQGYGKRNSSTPHGRAVSLGESMARYVESKLPIEHPRIQVRFKPLSWGTLGDLRSIPRMLGKIDSAYPPHIHFVTDPMHLKRVRLVWRHVHPRGWVTTFHAAKQHRMTWRERWIREPVARLWYRYQLLCGQ